MCLFFISMKQSRYLLTALLNHSAAMSDVAGHFDDSCLFPVCFSQGFN